MRPLGEVVLLSPPALLCPCPDAGTPPPPGDVLGSVSAIQLSLHQHHGTLGFEVILANKGACPGAILSHPSFPDPLHLTPSIKKKAKTRNQGT